MCISLLIFVKVVNVINILNKSILCTKYDVELYHMPRIIIYNLHYKFLHTYRYTLHTNIIKI